MNKLPKPKYFSTRRAWRTWLTKQHAQSSEQWVLFYKKHVGKGMQYPEAVEEALCFGWIDGMEQRIDDRKHMLRFTPRRPNSVWAPSNIARVKKLIKAKLMTPAGLQAFRMKKADRQIAPDASVPGSLTEPSDLKTALRRNAKAWKHWQNRAPSMRRIAIAWVTGAKQPATRLRRIRNVVSNAARYAKAHY